MALALAEQGDQDIGARHLVAAGGLDMDRRPLDDPLEAGRGLRIAPSVADQPGEVLVQELGEIPLELLQFDTAGAKHRGGVRVVAKGKKKVLQRRVLVPAVIRERQGAMERLFEVAGQHTEATLPSWSAPERDAPGTGWLEG